MIHWEKKNLRIVRELKKSDQPKTEEQEQFEKARKKRWKKTALIAAVVVALAVGVYLLINLQTYTSARALDTYTVSGASGSAYEQFADGVLKYSRDGISYLNQHGEEMWNQPYQMKNPVVDVNGSSAAVADKGGNVVLVFNEEGVRGETQTNLPIERVRVSEQGIVSVILTDENEARVLCYDAAGNLLVENKTSMNGTGYPLDVALSPDGETMQVLYLYTEAGAVKSRVIYYNFGESGEEKTDHLVAQMEYEDTVMASGFFMDENISVAVGDNRLTIYRGGNVPEETENIEIKKQIKSVFHNEKYIGMVLKNEGKEGYELRLYNTRGQVAMSENFTGDYSHVKLCGSQVIMYDGKNCSIFTRGGIHKFDGEMNSNILEIFPVPGVNKYIVMNENGLEVVRLVK
ncbi:hypothetical protein H6A17_00730 [Mordavella massiliensis]|nr:hypothetical protein [Mordavella massiliensis]